jgi:hypothetical protein
MPGYVTESRKQVPVAMEVDVAVAGAGISGVFAAIAAGRMGAKTALIDRFGSVGGNIGPGMIWGGGLYNEAAYTLPGGMAGIPKEFIERLEEALGDRAHNNSNISNTASHVAVQMLNEAKVRLMLSAYAADPIMEKKQVRGLFVETPSGRVAVTAKVTVDATGEGTLAMRAGAPMIRRTPPSPTFAPIVRPWCLEFPKAYDDTGLYAVITGFDRAAFDGFSNPWPRTTEDHQKNPALSDADKRWVKESAYWRWPASWIPAARKAWESGEFRAIYMYTPTIRLTGYPKVEAYGNETGSIRVEAHGLIFHDDWQQMTMLESALREHVFALLDFMRKNVPGMEKAYVVTIAPFLGTRGGPHIDAEHTLTVEESIAGARFDDVVFVNIHEGVHGGAKEGYDVPYRALLPKGIDGLIVVGRGAGYIRRGHDPSGIRARPSMMILGQCAGTAAALAARGKVTPKTLDVKKLQKALVKRGIVLGDRERLKALGLAR